MVPNFLPAGAEIGWGWNKVSRLHFSIGYGRDMLRDRKVGIKEVVDTLASDNVLFRIRRAHHVSEPRKIVCNSISDARYNFLITALAS
jgi:hypothetical protein